MAKLNPFFLVCILSNFLLVPPSFSEEEKPTFEKLRFEEDFSLFRAPDEGKKRLDKIKFIPLSKNGKVWLSLGGEARERYEYTGNPTFGQDPQDKSGVFLQRYTFHADLHIGNRVRVFVQSLSGLENGRATGPSPVDENRFTMQNAFGEFVLLEGKTELIIRGGRQELSFGSERLIAVREGPNVRRTFDGIRLIWTRAGWQVDGFWAKPRKDNLGVFDDRTDHSKSVWGAYATAPEGFLPLGQIDFYYIGFRDEKPIFVQDSALEKRQSIGIRLWGSKGNWDWNWEAVYQFGSFGQGEITAWTLATDTGFTFANFPGTPRLGFNANIASGDGSPNNVDLETFNAIFPRGSYFSHAAVLGPRNFYNFHTFFSFQLTRVWTMEVDLNAYWRVKTTDGVYSPSGQIIRGNTFVPQRFVGKAFNIGAEWQINRHLVFEAIFTHFFPGSYIKVTGPAETINFVEITLQFKF